MRGDRSVRASEALSFHKAIFRFHLGSDFMADLNASTAAGRAEVVRLKEVFYNQRRRHLSNSRMTSGDTVHEMTPNEGGMRKLNRLLRWLIRKLLPRRFVKLVNYGDTWRALYQTLIILAESVAWKLKFQLFDRPRIEIQAGELILITVVRNEAARLPYFLDYYFKLGVDRILVVNHLSTDNTRELCGKYSKVHVIDVKNGFHLKPIWIDSILRRYALNHWSMVIDADEFLVFDGIDAVNIKQLCQWLSREKATALRADLLDMFPQGPVSSAVLAPGMDPLDVAPYFDAANDGRRRAFGVRAAMRKIPLFFFTSKVLLQVGQHVIHGCQLSVLTGRLLHFKFTSDFAGDKTRQLARTATDGGLLDPWYTAQLKRYRATLHKNADVILARPESIRYRGTDQLLELGLMQSSADFRNWAHQQRQPMTKG